MMIKDSTFWLMVILITILFGLVVLPGSCKGATVSDIVVKANDTIYQVFDRLEEHSIMFNEYVPLDDFQVKIKPIIYYIGVKWTF